MATDQLICKNCGTVVSGDDAASAATCCAAQNLISTGSPLGRELLREHVLAEARERALRHPPAVRPVEPQEPTDRPQVPALVFVGKRPWYSPLLDGLEVVRSRRVVRSATALLALLATFLAYRHMAKLRETREVAALRAAREEMAEAVTSAQEDALLAAERARAAQRASALEQDLRGRETFEAQLEFLDGRRERLAERQRQAASDQAVRQRERDREVAQLEREDAERRRLLREEREAQRGAERAAAERQAAENERLAREQRLAELRAARIAECKASLDWRHDRLPHFSTVAQQSGRARCPDLAAERDALAPFLQGLGPSLRTPAESLYESLDWLARTCGDITQTHRRAGVVLKTEQAGGEFRKAQATCAELGLP